MEFKVNNKTGSPINYGNEVQSLCDFAKDRLGFQEHPNIFLNHDKRNASNTLGKTGHYDPNTMEIHVFATGRHPKDILRSIAHELVHHWQNENGELDHSGYMGKGYAQKNPKLRQSELEANDPMLFRDWEDSLKEKENTIYNERRNRKMSLKEWKNKELGGLLTSKWGFKMDLSKLNESKDLKECGEPMPEPHMHGGMPEEDCMDINGKRYCAEPEMSVGAIMENEGDSEDNVDDEEGEGEEEKPEKKKEPKKGKKGLPPGLKAYMDKRKAKK